MFALERKGNTFVHKTFDDFPSAAAKNTFFTETTTATATTRKSTTDTATATATDIATATTTTSTTTAATTTTSQLLLSYSIVLMGNLLSFNCRFSYT